jgi:opacity protein-like surface antigen
MLNNKMLMTKLVVLNCIIVFFALTMSTDANAKYSKRSGKWESSFKILNNQSLDIDGKNGSKTVIESDFGWGFTLGYNLNPHILFNFDFSSSTPSYDATLIDEDGSSFQVNNKLDVMESQFNVVYNVFTEQFTPFIQAGLGWTYLDSNIATGPPGAVCWWDPWWGYVCDYYQNTQDDERFSYNVAVGLRYELDNSLFFRASYKQAFINLSHSDANIGSFQLEVGSVF